MRRAINIWANLDWITVFLYMLLIIMGWLNIYAAVYSEQHKSIFDFDMRYGKQMLWIIAALLIAAVIIFIDTRFYSFFAYAIYAIAILVLLSVLILGKEVKGARSWFEIMGFHLQPSEFAKVATCLAVAKYLSSYSVKIEKFKTLFIVGILIVIPMFFIALQPDFGSLIIFVALIFVLYREGFPGWFLFFGFLLVTLFVLALLLDKMPILLILIVIALSSLILTNRRYREPVQMAISFIAFYWLTIGISHMLHIGINHYTALLVSSGITSIGFIVLSLVKKIRSLTWIIIFLWVAVSFTYSVNYVFNRFLAPHQQHRVNILLGIESDPGGAGYNINQSKIAIGSGGFIGKGYLQGTQTKFNFVPEQSTDFIFCTVGEEWGFLGSFVVLSLFALFLLRLIFLAERQRSAFSRIYGYGLISIMFFHIAINIGMTVGLLPVIGIPLPFFSYGGSALWAFTMLLFIFLRFDASRLELF
jgi:rod shape determining protein RodA